MKALATGGLGVLARRLAWVLIQRGDEIRIHRMNVAPVKPRVDAVRTVH